MLQLTGPWRSIQRTVLVQVSLSEVHHSATVACSQPLCCLDTRDNVHSARTSPGPSPPRLSQTDTVLHCALVTVRLVRIVSLETVALRFLSFVCFFCGLQFLAIFARHSAFVTVCVRVRVLFWESTLLQFHFFVCFFCCLLYTSDAADES